MKFSWFRVVSKEVEGKFYEITNKENHNTIKYHSDIKITRIIFWNNSNGKKIVKIILELDCENKIIFHFFPGDSLAFPEKFEFPAISNR